MRSKRSWLVIGTVQGLILGKAKEARKEREYTYGTLTMNEILSGYITFKLRTSSKKSS